MFSFNTRDVLCTIGKSTSKVFVPSSEAGSQQKRKEGGPRTLQVTFIHPQQGPKSFQVCLPPRSLKGPPGQIPANVYCSTEIPPNDFGVVALGVSVDPKAPRQDRFLNAKWFCRLKDDGGKDVAAVVLPLDKE